MRNRSPVSLAATLAWALICVVVGATWSPGWLVTVALLTVTILGGWLLWNLDSFVSAWRADRASRRAR